MNDKIDIKGIIADLDDLCKRLQDDYDDSVPFKQSEEDRLTVYNAIELFEKQIPKKVTHEATLYRCYTCPDCKNVIDEFTEFAGKTARVTVQYCKFCGQALDWGDTE